MIKFRIGNILKSALQLSIPVFLSMSSPGFTQTLVQDSVVLNFTSGLRNESAQPFTLIRFTDVRDVDDKNLVGIGETTKYLFIPVDKYVYTSKPVTEIVQSILQSDTEDIKPKFNLELKYFKISNKTYFLFFKSYRIRNLITVRDSDAVLIGELIFDSGSPPGIKHVSFREGYKNAFDNWLFDLKTGLTELAEHRQDSSRPIPGNFRLPHQKYPWMYLNASSEIILLNQGYLLDLHLQFNYAEAKPAFFSGNPTLRFRKQKRFSAIEYGICDITYSRRLNSRFIIKFRSNVMFGINRWNDMQEVKHLLYDALLADFSLSQSFHFHPIYKKSVTLGIGLFQNVYYIHSKGTTFQYGLIVQAGVQL